MCGFFKYVMLNLVDHGRSLNFLDPQIRNIPMTID